MSGDVSRQEALLTVLACHWFRAVVDVIWVLTLREHQKTPTTLDKGLFNRRRLVLFCLIWYRRRLIGMSRYILVIWWPAAERRPSVDVKVSWGRDGVGVRVSHDVFRVRTWRFLEPRVTWT